MEAMTDYLYQSILKSIKMILSCCSTIEEAQKKIDILLEKDVEKPKKEKK
ncbi:MAG: hypothetical protein K5985_04615 [Lachnospiraceae bacterium]|nr:hypothetical protein [Lachnospiraceae bacterium]